VQKEYSSIKVKIKGRFNYLKVFLSELLEIEKRKHNNNIHAL
jgi:hypothetical protein